MAQQSLPYGLIDNDPNNANDLPLREIVKRTGEMFSDLYSDRSTIVSSGDFQFSGELTTEEKIAAADAYCVAHGKTILFIPASMLPYDITLCPASAGVQRVREGGDASVYDVIAYGADPAGVIDAGPSWNACRAAIPAAGGPMRVPFGTYNLATAFTFGAQQNVVVLIDTGVTLTGQALPAVTGSSPVSPDFNSFIDLRGGVFSLTNRLVFPTNAAPNAPTIVDHVETVFSGTVDPCIYIGYNMSGLGSLIVPTEPGGAWGFEGNYNDGSGQNKMEAYVQFLATDFSVQRPFFASYNRVTKIAQPFLYGDTISFGRASQLESIASFTNDGTNGNRLTIFPTTSANGSFVFVNGKVGTVGALYFGITGTTLARLESTGATRVDLLVNNRTSMCWFATPNGGAGDSISVGVADNGAVATFNNSSAQNGLPVVVARGKSGQTADLFRAQSSTPATLWAVTAAGFMQVGANQVVGARVTGWTAATNTKLRTTFDTTTVTLPNLAARMGALLDDLIAHGLIGA